jgi:uncharacterized membrane protein YhaH (DUF805 family)
MKSNWLLLLSGLSAVLWLKGAYRIVDQLIPNSTINNILCLVAGLVMLLVIDGSLVSLGYNKPMPDDEHFNKKHQNI